MKKLISFLLIFAIIFSLFPDVLVVNADAEVDDMRFERIKQVGTIDAFDTLYIYGSGFTNPAVKAGTNGAIPVSINTQLSTEYKLVIDNQDELKNIIIGKPNKIKVYNEGVEVTEGGLDFDLSSIPTVKSTSKSKAYVGESLVIDGDQFGGLVPGTDKLYISNTGYVLHIGDDGDDATADIIGDSIYISKLMPPNVNGVTDVAVTRTVGGYEITSILEDSITVAQRITGIQVERIDPNAGPRNKRNVISIYGTPDNCDFRSDMRIFADSVEGTPMGTIENSAGVVIGIKFELPTRDTAGAVDLVLTTNDLGSDLVIPAGFMYLDIGNTLTIDSDGVNPNFKKETEEKIIEIKGRNIGFFNGMGYDKVKEVAPAADRYNYKYERYGSDDMFNNSTYYKLKYTGKYESPEGDIGITIIRQFRITINEDATVVDSVYGGVDYAPDFRLRGDTLYVSPKPVNLDMNESISVDVAAYTITTIFVEEEGVIKTLLYNRAEEYVLKNGFTYLPDEIAPVIDSVTPEYGPSSENIYMTIKGENFQVIENPDAPGEFLLPEIRIGNTTCESVRVYDSNNRVADGRIITLGTKIKCILPASAIPVDLAVDVVVVNPSSGQDTLTNGFQYRNPVLPREVRIISVVNNYADMRGGIVSGETIRITGENFDTSPDENPRVVITIEGEKATIIGKVSSDGKTVTIIPPPGTAAGPTKLQLINEDGSMASADFEYKRITSNPKITSIIPLKGGKGTKLIIKGEDFVLPDYAADVDNNDPKKKGSVVLLGGIELNAYKYNEDGVITNVDPITGHLTSDIYYEGMYDPDGPGEQPSYFLDGHMIKVQDITTIYVDVPERFYSFVGGAAPEAPYLKSDMIPVGSLKVEVLNPDGAKSKEDVRFNYMRPSTVPQIDNVNPKSGSVAGGTVVTITGSGFKEDYIEVYFGSEKSESVEFINSTLIRAEVPDYPYALPAGQDFLDVPVMVLNYDGGAAVLDDGFRYRVPGSNPVISSITPNNGSSAGNDRVVIRGLDFRRTPDFSDEGLPKVYFNGREAEVEWPAINDTTITESLTVITPPSLTSGTAEVILVNHDSGTCIYRGFTYIMSRPSITSVMPGRIDRKGNVNVQINGSGFRVGNLEDLFTGTVEKVQRNDGSGINAEDVIETITAFGDFDTGDKRMIDTVLGPMYAEIGDLRFDCVVTGGATEQVNVRISLASDSTHSTIRRYRMDGDVKTFDSMAEADITIGSSHLFIINHNMDLN
ncbi:MAG TPA: IPT/TIG domain-containing protein, partial [Bacillota bacterium]|nr:IPT/TIG domain-containing protein [Bacillota bacterium]